MLYSSLTKKEKARLMTDNELRAVIGESGCRPEDSFSTYLDMLPEDRQMFAYAVIELYERNKTERRKSPKMVSPDDAYKYIRHIAVNNDKEEMHMIGLDATNRVIMKRRISIGTIYGCKMSIPEIIREASINKCFGFIIAHNHPMGYAKPSTADNQITKELKAASELVGLKFLDHLIVTTREYYSYKTEGKL